MAVLTNENTASAAELFTQALRDFGVAKSVGSTTYGKGVMQITHSLKDGSAIRITVAQYNPPKSPNYDGIGIKPDYEVALTEEQQKNLDQLNETNDPQLMKALEITRSTPASSQPVVETIGDSGSSDVEIITEPEEPATEETTTEE